MAVSDGGRNEAGAALDRRGFLQRGIGAGAALIAARAWAGSASASATAPGGAPGTLEEATIADLQRAMESGATTARGLAESYLARIRQLDQAGPRLNSVIELNPDALAIADALDAERRSKGSRGLLHGIPVLIKDNIDTADKMRTSAGSLALAESIAPRDATVAARLRAAGALILGKTNLSEWANFRSTRSTSGWSGRGGQTHNPYALDRNPCGSSSGTAVAVSANLVAVGIGTETDGSIVCPSHTNGIVGIKPTVGLVSRAGIIPISATQDTAGPMCRTVADAAVLLAAIAGDDPRDPSTARGRGKTADYQAALDPNGLKGARIGVARKLFNAGPLADAVMERALAALKSAGAVLVDPADIPFVGKYDDDEFEVLLFEFKEGLNAYLAALGGGAPHRTLADLIKFNEANRTHEMPYFGQEVFVKAEATGAATRDKYVKALRKCRRMSRTEGIDAALAKHRLDAVVTPTGGPAWTTDLVNGDHFGGSSSTPAAVAGYPSITVPAGEAFGLPIGMSFIGAAWSEAKLIRLAYAFEQATKARIRPALLPTLELAADRQVPPVMPPR